MKDSKRVWTEDDCTSGTEGHVTIQQMWRGLFGEELDTKKALRKEDCGDYDKFWMPNGYIAILSYPGGSAIYKE